MRKIILSLCLLILIIGVASAEYTGYTTYTSSGVDGDTTISFGAELDISQISVDIDNNVPTGSLSDGTTATKAKPITIPAAGIHQLNVVYDSDMQTDFDDLRFGYADGSLVPFNYYEKVDGSYIKLWVQTTNSNQLYMFYGDATASSGDDGEATFTEPVNPEIQTDSGTTTTSSTYVLAATQTFTTGDFYGSLNVDEVSCTIGSAGGTGVGSQGKATVQIDGGSEQTVIEEFVFQPDDGFGITYSVNPALSSSVEGTVTVRYYIRKTEGLYQASISNCEATVSKSYLSTGSEQVVGPQSFTLSATGDSETKSIGASGADSFSIIPTANISSFDITTTSDDYDYSASVYWTEDTATINETVNNSHAVLDVDYTPTSTITSGTLDLVFNTVDLTQYTGPITCTIDGSPASATLTGNNVEITLSSLDTSAHDIIVTVPYNLAPELTSPADGSSANYTFPPHLHDVTLDWENTYADSYKYELASDTGFNYLLKSGETTSTSQTVTLAVPETYYWRVYANYDGIYSPVSDVYSFTMNADTSTTTGTGVNGIVYDASENVIPSATISIYNNTWSDSALSTTEGYYLFTGLSNGTYFLQASKDGYSSSPVATATVTDGEIYTVNLLLQKQDAANYILPHYVQLYVKSLWNTYYPGVTITVYEGDSATALGTKVTDSTGGVGFELKETVTYRITAYSEELGIDEETTLTPTKDTHNIYVSRSLWDYIDPTPISMEEVEVSVDGQEINATHAYINVSYSDAMSETTNLDIYVKQSNKSDPLNQTTITSNNFGAVSETNHSFIISDYSGKGYFVNAIAEHDTFGTIDRTYSVQFQGMNENFGWSKIWIWLAVGGMIFVAGMFGKESVNQGAITVCVLAWIMYGMGWFSRYNTTSLFMGLSLATVISVASYMNQKSKEEGS